MINLPSLANCNMLHIGEQIDALVKGGVQMVHVDIMDGHYVPNLCFPASIVHYIKTEYPELKIDVHMMVLDPMQYIPKLKEYGADYVSFHIDSTPFCVRTLKAIKEAGMKCGVAINPSQRIDVIQPFFQLLDYVVLMAVEPGFAGQRFLDGQLERLEELERFRRENQADYLISIDGGIDYYHAEECLKRGADMLVTGIYVVFDQEIGIDAACRRFADKMSLVPHTVRTI